MPCFLTYAVHAPIHKSGSELLFSLHIPTQEQLFQTFPHVTSCLPASSGRGKKILGKYFPDINFTRTIQANSNGGSKQEHANNELLKRASYTHSLARAAEGTLCREQAKRSLVRSLKFERVERRMLSRIYTRNHIHLSIRFLPNGFPWKCSRLPPLVSASIHGTRVPFLRYL